MNKKKQFLIFVWGRSTLPTRDEDFGCNFTINSYLSYDSSDVDKALPRMFLFFFKI